MIHLQIERFYGNKKVTQGRLTIEGSNFACYTLEACDPSFAPVKNKSIMALPIGDYRMRLFFDDLQYNLRFSNSGTYHTACFDIGKKPVDVALGSVILGTSFNGKFQIEGSEFAMEKLGKYLAIQTHRTLINYRKLGDITISIVRSPDFIYDGKAKPQPNPIEMEEEDWDLIDH